MKHIILIYAGYIIGSAATLFALVCVIKVKIQIKRMKKNGQLFRS